MSEAWIEELAGEIRRKNREAAERYGREQHFAGVIEAGAPGFFLALTEYLRENVEGIRRSLQGDVTAAEMAVERGAVNGVRIVRARFPWVDARVTHQEETITLDYAKDAAVVGEVTAERMVRMFVFRVGADDRMYVEDGFSERPERYETAERLARKITELLFSV